MYVYAAEDIFKGAIKTLLITYVWLIVVYDIT